MTADLSGRLALVTGALGKLGPVWIEALAGAGARVVGVDVRAGEVDGAESVEVADVTDREALLALRERIGAPDVLVNNAGIDLPPSGDAGSQAIEDVPLDDFRRVLDVNLTGTFLATHSWRRGSWARRCGPRAAARSSTPGPSTRGSLPTRRCTTISTSIRPS